MTDKMKLNFINSKEYSDSYGGCSVKYKPSTELDVVIGFKHEMREISIKFANDNTRLLSKLNERTGWISSKIRWRKHIMMMDIDFKDFKDEVCDMLRDELVAHTVFESSEGRFWVIADIFKTGKISMAKALREYVNIDTKYIALGRDQGFKLRAFPRSAVVPVVIARFGVGSKDYINYIAAMERYWESPHIKWMVQEYIINAL